MKTDLLSTHSSGLMSLVDVGLSLLRVIYLVIFVLLYGYGWDVDDGSDNVRGCYNKWVMDFLLSIYLKFCHTSGCPTNMYK